MCVVDADNFEPNEPLKAVAGLQDRWEGEDEEDDVKVTRKSVSSNSLLCVLKIKSEFQMF